MTMSELTFGPPWLLACLLLPALALVGYVWLERRPPKAAVAYPNLAFSPRSRAGRAGGGMSSRVSSSGRSRSFASRSPGPGSR